MKDNGMFKTFCAGCGKVGYVFARDRMGHLPTYYCSDVCKGNVNYEKKFK